AIINSSAMIRKDFLIKNKISYRDESFVGDEDYRFWVDCINKGAKIARLPKTLITYRIRNNNITNESSKNKNKERKQSIDKIRKQGLKNNGILLSEEEYTLFNIIFSDPIVDITLEDINNYKELIKKIITMKQGRNFANEIKASLVNKVISLNCSKLEKLKTINFRIKDEDIVSYIRAIVKTIILG
ncbi:hypothetical protein, partial [Intestinibacter sp.]